MRKPNVVFVLTDDQGYGDLRCTGNPWIQTPNIDAFHDESVRLTNYHVGPTCAPTRSGLMTGHYANSTGVWHTIGGRSLLRSDEWSIADAFRENGYETGIFGKWHLGDNYPYRPQDRGFSQVVVHGGGAISQAWDYWGNDYFDDTYLVNGEYQKFHGYCTDIFFDEAKKFIKKNKDRPFFCYLPTNAPHAPFNVHPKYSGLYSNLIESRARFYGMITNIDENFGKLQEFLREEGLEDNTILIFMTDNGSCQSPTYDEQGNMIEGYNAGFRGIKDSEYDGGHRVPFFIRYPDGHIEGGKDCNELTANVDVMPTLLDLCGIESGKHTFHGISIRNILENTEDKLPDRYVVTDSQRDVHPLKWKKSAVMRGEMRLVDGRELYDMTGDRAQEHDIAAEHPDIVEAMRKEYDKWWDMVSVRFDEPIPMYITRKTKLVGHDWRGDIYDCIIGQNIVREGQKRRGYWEVLAEKTGMYRFHAYRWAPETGYALSQGIEGNDSGFIREYVPKERWCHFENGVAIDIESASLSLDGEVVQTISNVDGTKPYAEFLVHVEKGNHDLEIDFKERGAGEFGAYYAIIEWVSE